MEYEEDRIGRIGWGVENSIAYCSLSIYIYMHITYTRIIRIFNAVDLLQLGEGAHVNVMSCHGC